MSAYVLPWLLVSAAEPVGPPATPELQRKPSAFECCARGDSVRAAPTDAEPAADRTLDVIAEQSALPFTISDASPAQLAVQFVAAVAPSPSADDPSVARFSDEPQLSLRGDGMESVEPRYSARVFWEEAKSIPWRFGGAAAAITATGFANWDWGSSRFRFNSEGWFGKDTASLGVDKLGHAYSSYVLTEFFTDGITSASADPRSRSYTGAILSMGLMTYIEVFDGFSKEHGFSYEDLVTDAAGALFSVARRSIPGLREKVDFRLLYKPSRGTWNALSCLPAPHCDREGVTVRSPITDYSGQRYLLAAKLSGFERFRQTPLRLIELHAGYYARGFTREEEDRGDPLRRRLFVGVGLNVGELLFPGQPRGVGRAAKSVLEYLQLPYTAVHSD